MRVDQERQVGVVGILGAACKMDFADRRHREIGEIAMRIAPVVGRADEDVVDVEQKAASGPPDDLGEKLGFFDGGFGEGDVGGRVFEQDRPAERALRLIDMLDRPGPASRRRTAGAGDR